MKYHFKVHKDIDMFWAECVELEGCSTQGKTMDDLYANCVEALHLYLDESPETPEPRIIFPLPDESLHKKSGIIEIPVDPSLAFAVQLRYQRHRAKLSQKQVMVQLGMKNLNSYQRLERKPNPTLKTINEIKRVFPEIDIQTLFEEVPPRTLPDDVEGGRKGVPWKIRTGGRKYGIL